MDSTSIKVCHNRRISSHKVFNPLTARGKTSVGWFRGFERNLVMNEQGELLNAIVTPGNKVFGDRGYVSQKLALQLWHDWGLQLVTKLKRNMKTRLMPLAAFVAAPTTSHY